MRKTITIAACAAIALAAAVPAAAQTVSDRSLTAAETADLHCMAVYSLLAAQPGKAEAGAIGVFYFLGRLEGRDAGMDWLERFYKFAQAETEADIQANAERCGQALIERGQALERVGARLTAPGAAS